MKKHSLFILVIISLALGIGIWRDHQLKSPTVNLMSTTTPLKAGTLLSRTHKLPGFSMSDQNSRSFTQDSLKNHWSFVFFGYSSCPDVCPMTLAAMGQIYHHTKKIPQVQYVFVTIDPQRDRPEQLKQYFDKDEFKQIPFVALTGEQEAIQNLTKTIGIHVNEADPTGNIDHSGALLLVNPEGKLTALFTTADQPQVIAQDLKTIMHLYANGR